MCLAVPPRRNARGYSIATKPSAEGIGVVGPVCQQSLWPLSGPNQETRAAGLGLRGLLHPRLCHGLPGGIFEMTSSELKIARIAVWTYSGQQQVKSHHLTFWVPILQKHRGSSSYAQTGVGYRHSRSWTRLSQVQLSREGLYDVCCNA